MAQIATVNRIIPSEEEKVMWKKFLYNRLAFLATERPEFFPNEHDDLDTLLESFLYWADTYNEGYFCERDIADKDRYSLWLIEQHDELFGN